MGPETSCEKPNVSIEDIRSEFCLDAGSLAWMLKSPSIIVLGYCSLQEAAVSRSPDRASAGAVGER